MFGGGRTLVFEFEFVSSSSSSIPFFECQVFRGGAYELVHNLVHEYKSLEIIGGVVVEPYFKGIQPVKRIKRVVHFIITLFGRYWTINRHQINSI